MISSPFIRTLQTAAYFQNSILTSLGCQNPDKETIIVNKNISVKLGKESHKIFKDGILKKESSLKLLRIWLDSKVGKIEKDDNAITLFLEDGKFKDQRVSERYTKGIEDILKRHFLDD